MSTSTRRLRGAGPVLRRLAAGGTALLALASAVLFTACEGENLFGNGDAGRTPGDESVPGVEIQQPGDGTTIPLGDSLLVAVGLQDDAGVDTVRLVGLSFRGDPTLGTDTTVVRYVERTVVLSELPTDTVLLRYLQPTADSTAETVHVIAMATDLRGNVMTDTVAVLVGAPRVEIQNLADGDTVQAGRTLAVRIFAADRAGVSQVQLGYAGVTQGELTQSFSTPADSVVVDTALALPDGATGALHLVATARNTADQIGRTDTLTLEVTTTAQEDTVAPAVGFDIASAPRMELLDTVRVTVRAGDDTQGSGLVRMGVTALAMSTAKTDTLVWSDTHVFSSPRTGSVVRDFAFTPAFRADTAALPDTLIFELHAYAVDESGNCAASVQSEEQSHACGEFRGDTVSAEAIGQRVDVVAVTGHTVRLPDGGVIADAVLDVDTTEQRLRLYLSNFSTNQVDVMNLADSAFVGQVSVGAQPWGLFIDNSGDTLLVANSGGTNISFVPLQTGGDPTHVPQERLARRLLTPNAVLFDFEIKTNEGGGITYTVYRHDFSDRPQFIAQDSTGRFLYSTVPTSAAPDGTVRVVDEDPDPTGSVDVPEARILFDETKALDPNEDFIAIANLDSLVVRPDPARGDIPSVCDHQPGYPSTAVCVDADYTAGVSLAEALDSLRTLTGDNQLFWRAGKRWVLEAVGMSDTTFVAASGDRGTIAFGEGATAPTGRIMLWHAHTDPDSSQVSDDINIEDLVNNASERVLGVGLNRNGSLGVARGVEAAYFFDKNLRLQGSYVTDLGDGGAGAGLHPDHAAVLETGEAALSFVATSDHSIRIVNTTHFDLRGEIFIRDNIVGPLRVSPPFPTDNNGAGAACVGSECVIAKLYGVTSSGGVVIVDVKRRDLQ